MDFLQCSSLTTFHLPDNIHQIKNLNTFGHQYSCNIVQGFTFFRILHGGVGNGCWGKNENEGEREKGEKRLKNASLRV